MRRELMGAEELYTSEDQVQMMIAYTHCSYSVLPWRVLEFV